MPTITKIKN
jgi:CheY-like chemotaxis protein